MLSAARKKTVQARGKIFSLSSRRSKRVGKSSLMMFDEYAKSPAIISVGNIVERTDVQSSMGPFRYFPDYQITYPQVVVDALGELYAEYNKAFIPLMEKNREWPTDYGYCMQEGLPVNFAVQIDMVGLPERFLQLAAGMSVSTVREILRRRIFEIENSLAMYQLLEKCCSKGGNSFFKNRFRVVLSKLSKRFGKPIALLAVTEQKYQAMKESEFGKGPGEVLTDEEVKLLSGFDRFFGPDEFREYISSHQGKCEYLLYARTSDPISRLKDPGVEVEHPLLADPAMRKLIKANVITFNVDAPGMDPARRINDTKEYQTRAGMGFAITSEEDLYSLGFAAHLFARGGYPTYKGARLSPEFAAYLENQEINPTKVESGEVQLRCKPIKCAYGCYGHLSGALTNSKFRGELRRNLRQREGGYIVQPEMTIPRIISGTDGQEYSYIDRNFLAFLNGSPVFIGGFRSMIPADNHETKKRRNHGNGSTVWAEIITA